MSLDPIRDDIIVRQSATFNDTLQCLDADGAGALLEGCGARMQVRSSAGAPALLTLTTAAAGGLVLDAEASTIARTVTDEQTSALWPGSWSYDLFVTWPDGHADCIAVGDFVVEARITLDAAP